MALKPVTDAAVLAQLDTAPPAPQRNLKPVTDPALLAQLDGTELPAAPPPKDGDATPATGAPKGFYSVTGDDGKDTLRRELGAGDVVQSLGNLPGVGTVMHTATGAYNTAVKALAGLFGLASGGNADVVKGTREGLSVEAPPSNDPLMQGLGLAERGARKLTAPVDQAVENLPDGPRTVVQGVEEAIPDVAAIAGARVPLKGAATDNIVSGAARASTEDAVGTLRAAGYKLRPSDVQAIKPGEKVPGLLREKLQDPAGLRKDFTLENQATTTKLAAEDLGAPGKTSLMEKDYDKLRQPHFKVYDDVEAAVAANPSEDLQAAYDAAKGRTNFKPTDKPSTTQIIGALRRQEVKRARSDDIAANREGQLDRDAADSLEGVLEQQLKATGNQKLYTDYVASRRALAKIHDYETATRGGQVDAQRMFRMDERSPGRFTGNAKIIADAGGYAKNVVRHGQGATGMRSSVKADSLFGDIKHGASKLVSKLPGLDITRDSFQNGAFGREAVTPAERGSFRDYGKRPEKPQAPKEVDPQQSMDLAAGFGLDAPPGVTPSRTEQPLAAMPTEQLEALGPLMDLIPTEGTTPSRIMPSTPTPGPDFLGELLQLVMPEGQTPGRIMPPTPKPGEQWFDPSIDLAPPPGRVGKLRKPKK